MPNSEKPDISADALNAPTPDELAVWALIENSCQSEKHDGSTDTRQGPSGDELVAWALIEKSRFHKGREFLDERVAMSVDEFCRWASIGRSKFYQEVGSGRIRLRKIGRKSVVTMPDALAWLSNLPLAG